VDCVAKTTNGKFIVPWLWLRVFTGTRPTESTFIEWDDIDFKNDRIHIRPKTDSQLKNGKFRVVVMHPELKKILLAWRDEWQIIHDRWLHRNKMDRNRKDREILPDHQWVFINPKSHGQRAKTFTTTLDKARKSVGLPSLCSHTFRHYFISHCVMSEINFYAIAKWVGHSNSKIIEEVYGHLNDGYHKEQMAKLEFV